MEFRSECHSKILEFQLYIFQPRYKRRRDPSIPFSKFLYRLELSWTKFQNKQSFKSTCSLQQKKSRMSPRLTVYYTLTIDICKCQNNHNNCVYLKKYVRGIHWIYYLADTNCIARVLMVLRRMVLHGHLYK